MLLPSYESFRLLNTRCTCSMRISSQPMPKEARKMQEHHDTIISVINLKGGSSIAAAEFIIHCSLIPQAVEAIPAPPIDILPPLHILVCTCHYPPKLNNLLFSPAQAQKVQQSVPFVSDKKCVTSSSVNPIHYGMDQRPDAEKTIKEGLYPQQDLSCVLTGIFDRDALCKVTMIVTSVQAVETRTTVLRSVLKHRKNQVLTPYNPSIWDQLLQECNLLEKYPNLSNSLSCGFDTGIWRLYKTTTPSNGSTIYDYPEAYQQIIDKEFQWGCYMALALMMKSKPLLGLVSSSLLSLVPKPEKPGKFWAVHNFSYPCIPSLNISSINYTIDSNMYPCIWGTFSTICYTIHNLPPGLQASIRNVAEEYHTIPIIYSQWPGLVVKLQENVSFAINSCNNFGLASTGGIYGKVGDATTDILEHKELAQYLLGVVICWGAN